MKAKASAAAEDGAEPKKIRSSRSKRRRRHHSHPSSSSESPPRKRTKKHSKRVPDKKSKRSKASGGSSRRRRHRSLSPSRSLSSSSSPSSVARRSCSSCSSSGASERSVSPPPPRSRSRDVRKKKVRGRGRDRERDRKGRKLRRSASSSSTSASSGSSRSRSRNKSKIKSRKRRTVGGTKDGDTRDKMEKDYTNRRSSWSDMNVDEDVDKEEDKLAIAKEADNDIDRHKKNSELESSPSKNANEMEEIVSASGGNSDAQDLELILRQKALENFRKFRAAATMGGKTDNGAAGKEALADDSLKNAGTKVAEAAHFQSQGSSLEARLSAGSPRSQNFGNGASHSWKQENSAGLSYGAGSPGILEPAETGGSTQLKGRTVESTRLASQFLSPLDARNGRSVMQRLVPPPGSSASVNQRLGSSAGLNHVNGVPRIRSVVSIPNRERLDGSTHTTPPRLSEDSSPVESSDKVGLPLNDTNKAEGTSVENRKTSEDPASNGSVLSPAEDKSQPRIEDKDSFQKKTFSRMHDGETVEVSYKVYIPKKTPALARRKLQR
ncbi:unnamed protein product [Miscanthus lutarioriparius]|uniref:Uncharacterized protein n=1 Tax=Miscanthus lutarioriparius TaxID=422564 RepID=A0A811NDF2_9POAL|nr:unnamed protein product [Miscanthus lutarioriparius]